MTHDAIRRSFKTARSLFSQFALSSLLLAATIGGCGNGFRPGSQDRPDGLAPMYGDECEAVEEGVYLLSYNAVGGGELSAIDADIDSIKQAGGSVRAVFSPQIPMIAAEVSPDMLSILRSNPDLSFVSKNCKYRRQSSDQARVPWGLDRIDQRGPTLDFVYQMPGTGRGIDVYVVDSGIYTAHPQFGGRAHGLYKAGSIMDGNGADDCSGHGTEVAGVIGGIDYGVAKESNLYAVRVADCSDVATDLSIADGLQHAVMDHQARNTPGVINISMAQTGLGPAASAAIDSAVKAGLLVVGAAGNYGVDACTHFPAARPGIMGPERDPNVLVAGVVNQQDQALSSAVANGSLIKFDFGNCIDLYAPGIDIRSAGAPLPWNTDPTGEAIDSGTSLAAAHVTGVVALYLERFPRATPAQIKQGVKLQATGGVVTGAITPSPLLVFNGNLVAPRAIQLAMPLLSRPVMQQGEIWEKTSFLINAIPDGRHAILSSDLAGATGTAVDDIFEMDCSDVDPMGASFGTARSRAINYNLGLCDYIRVLPPQDLSELVVRNQGGRCHLQLRDLCSVRYSTTRLFLNIQ